jgi:hypothetical protein
MKKVLTIAFLFALVVNVLGQAKKPTIMVVPSDRYCIDKGYKQEFNNQGTKVVLPDYKAALQNDADLRLVISKMSGIMGDRGFPLKDLEQELKKIEQEAAELSVMSSSEGSTIEESPIDVLKRTAKADIIMDLDFQIKRQGPQKYITFTLNGLDAYTAKNIASATGAGKPSTAATPEILLEEAVLSHMDNFNGRLMATFQDMFAKGREITVYIRVFNGWGSNLEAEYDYNGNYDMLSMHIEDWMTDNAQEGRFSLSDGTENFMKFEQVRMPMTYTRNGKERGMDARRFVNGLRQMLRQDPFGIDCKLYMKGLGEAWLIVGEK